eukprot:gene3593-biopygen3532
MRPRIEAVRGGTRHQPEPGTRRERLAGLVSGQALVPESRLLVPVVGDPRRQGALGVRAAAGVVGNAVNGLESAAEPAPARPNFSVTKPWHYSAAAGRGVQRSQGVCTRVHGGQPSGEGTCPRRGASKWRFAGDGLSLAQLPSRRKMETLKRLGRLAKPDDWRLSFHLRDGYRHVGMAPTFQKAVCRAGGAAPGQSPPLGKQRHSAHFRQARSGAGGAPPLPEVCGGSAGKHGGFQEGAGRAGASQDAGARKDAGETSIGRVPGKGGSCTSLGAHTLMRRDES